MPGQPAGPAPASLLEVERVQFLVQTGASTPGPGSYNGLEGMAADKKRWMVSSTWPRSQTVEGARPVSPGPAAYGVSEMLGMHSTATRPVSPRPVVGYAKRFEPVTLGLHSHAYAGADSLNAGDGGGVKGPLSGTFAVAAARSGAPRSFSPGPIYLVPGIGAKPEFPNTISATAPRFPALRESSPGPIYGVAPRPSSRGARFGPKAAGAATRKPKPRHPAILSARAAAPAPALFKPSAGTGPVFSAPTPLPFKRAPTPGPQHYDVFEAAIKRTPPAFSFGQGFEAAATGMPSRGAKGHGDSAQNSSSGRRSPRSSKKEQQAGASKVPDDAHAIPGPGAYSVPVLTGGPAHSIAPPTKTFTHSSPGPADYSAAKYNRSSKPRAPTFSRATRFMHDAAADTPGPGYYNTFLMKRKTHHAHGLSKACPDVIGFLAKKRENEQRRYDDMQEANRRMLITGSQETVDSNMQEAAGKVPAFFLYYLLLRAL
ncbi:H-SHIPPO 1 [Diplonema papillatum]|nr:H-SHIPPO 1 [Diplonema papillatum]